MSDPAQENRLRKFAGFFKSYMGVMPLVTAAVAPILTMSKAIPVFDSEKSTLATYSGLLGFLIVAWVFYARSMFVPLMVPYHAPALPPNANRDLKSWEYARARIEKRRHQLANLFPLLLIVLSAMSYCFYLIILDDALNLGQQSFRTSSRKTLLQTMGTDYSIPYHGVLQALYLGIFVFAEAAFVVMALREYAYGLLKIPEIEVLGGMAMRADSDSSQTADAPPQTMSQL
ncbi:MAG: hypothetical protein WBE76_14425 [Terracidiphilus sp.]